MRDAFISALTRLAEEDPNILLMTGDLGFGVLDDFQTRFPSQFLNVGVAEQNLTGVGVGIALAGHTVVTYSIGNFPTLRCLEQIRNDLCYHDADLKIVTIGGGMAYGALGPSHFATEDLAIMRVLPNMTVVAPGDPVEVEQLVPQVLKHRGPVYLRLGRAGEDRLHGDGSEILLGQPALVRRGGEVLLLSTGGILPVVLDAVLALEKEGVSCQVLSVHTLRPLDEAGIAAMASRFPIVVTCEEHSILGGLGGSIAEVLMEAGVRTRFRRFGLDPSFPRGIGSQQYLLKENGLATRDLVSTVLSLRV